jgi:hypothetical protein
LGDGAAARSPTPAPATGIGTVVDFPGKDGSSGVRGQPRTNTFHRPERVLCEKDDP